MKRRDLLLYSVGATALISVPPTLVTFGPQIFGDQEDAHTERYKDREIRVAGETVHIDGRELHLMRIGEGAYLSSLCHYRLQRTPLDAARVAVDELRGADLLPSSSHHA
ncbi:tyrosinase family oxidase copper chaperone [Nocardiopsis lucentensis]|uniref:tyrosinase family oxidase copper chaperone n=1 Tax=Nocardiopsis lucentensis TaxID=53441 RepID=UPI00034D9B98|nr:tyrosinase family oxidase copper chaperone [Nocardiopsis lucentensis]